MSNETSFRLTCPAEQVYLRLTPDGGGSAMIPMRHDGAQQDWEVDVPLAPGLYRFRYYYVERGGRLMLYHPPGGADGAKLDGLDGVLRVGGDGTAA